MYSRTLPQLLIRKTRPCLALHPPMVMGRFAYLAALVVYKSTLPALLVRKLHSPMVMGRFAYLAALVVYKKYTPSAARAQSSFFVSHCIRHPSLKLWMTSRQ
ncbi:MAG: hypothetical protein IKC77_05250, partial [Lentisphaeria bacterium]|nr:hypothetical protein [Lentisphaeria bacterium]